MGKFLDFIGKAANAIGTVAGVASNFVPGLSKVANIAKGVGSIANAYSQGKGQREAISNFVGDTFGKQWGNIANKAIGAGEQIFKTGKSVVASTQGFKSNPLGNLQNMASGIGRIGNILGGASGSLGSQMRGMGGAAGRFGNAMTGLSRDINTARNSIAAGRQAATNTMNQLRGPASQVMSAGRQMGDAIRSLR